MSKVLSSLRQWFLLHFMVDYLIGIPLLLAPEWTLALFGFAPVEVFTARLVGAALLAIGGVSLLPHSRKVYDILLSLKIIWALTAFLGILFSISEGAPRAAWLFLAIFTFFGCVWIYFKVQLKGVPRERR
jgi:hypothetical protein